MSNIIPERIQNKQHEQLQQRCIYAPIIKNRYNHISKAAKAKARQRNIHGSKILVHSQNAGKKPGGPVGRPVKDRYTNTVYTSANHAAKETGLNRSEIYKEVTSITTSKTRFVYE